MWWVYVRLVGCSVVCCIVCLVRCGCLCWWLVVFDWLVCFVGLVVVLVW